MDQELGRKLSEISWEDAKELEVLSAKLWALFSSLVNDGFNEEQAMQLTIAYIASKGDTNGSLV
jgi:hypothetical protein